MNIYQLIRELNAAKDKMVIAAQSSLNSVIPQLIADFKSRSPVDTGGYKESWFKAAARFSGLGVIAGAVIRNDDPKASLMEFGADPGEAPWYYPNKKKRSGKLRASGGRIWAGGLTPGHANTIGGAIDPVLYKNSTRQLQIAKTIAKSVVKVI